MQFFMKKGKFVHKRYTGCVDELVCRGLIDVF